MDTLSVYNQVALAMAYCNGATNETAKEMAESMPLQDIINCTKAIILIINSTRLINSLN